MSSLKVVELTALHVAIPLKRAIRHASHTRTSTDNLIVRCLLADGTEGYGEGVPRDYVTGETLDSSIQLLKQSYLPNQVEDCQTFLEAVHLAERLKVAPVPGDERGCNGNAARCALELAILDAFGRHYGEGLKEVTRLLAPELHRAVPEVRYSGVITSARGLKARLVAWGMRVYGFQQIKAKVGITGQDDSKRLRTIRSAVGPAMDLRIDANEAWNLEEAVHHIRALENFNITSVEQPMPHAELDKFAELRRQVKTPIMLDESLCSFYDAEQAAQRQACDLFNLRLSKCGGYIPSLRLMQFAVKYGIGCQLGCQVGETALLSAAGRHFATSVRGLRYLEGSYDRHLVREALGIEDMTFQRGGLAKAVVGPGLGVTVDAEALERVTVRKEALLG
ncbi:MAG: mandelate racemase/muconate lactonizing enzyme family protein [Gemmataceae bacterium]